MNLQLNNKNSDPDNRKRGFDSTTKGKVVVKYSNYVINKGINDSVFEEKKN